MTHKPEIRINFSHLLYGVSRSLDSCINSDKSRLASVEQCEEWAEAYRNEWAKYDEQILDALHQILGLSFYRDVVDVSLAPFFIPQSDPLIMHFRNEPDMFVDVLAHELTHVLLTDNEIVQINSHHNAIDLEREWRTLFGEEHDFKTLVHIPVHATLKCLYLDYMHNESRFTRDVERSKALNNGDSYVASWQFVNDHDHHDIISDLKKSYSSMKNIKSSS